MGEEARFVARYASTYVRGDSFAEVGDVLASRGFDMVRASQTERGVLIIPHKKEDRQAAHLFAMLDPVQAEAKEEDEQQHNGHNGHDHNGHNGHQIAAMSLNAPGLLDGPPSDPDERAVWAQARVREMQSALDNPPMSVDVASTHLVSAEVDAGLVQPIPLTCGECGAVHPEGVVCLIPIMYESEDCCPHVMKTYAHEGPHEAGYRDPKTDQIVITHRWVEELVCTDVPFDAYGPRQDEEVS